MNFDEDRYRERLKRWAQEELPRYEIDGWAGERRDGSGGGLMGRDPTASKDSGASNTHKLPPKRTDPRGTRWRSESRSLTTASAPEYCI